jgi:hypothetical protein
MSWNDFDNVPQCFQIPATEKPEFFAVRSGTERLTYAASTPGAMHFATGSPPLELKKARSPAFSTAPYPPSHPSWRC